MVFVKRALFWKTLNQFSCTQRNEKNCKQTLVVRNNGLAEWFYEQLHSFCWSGKTFTPKQPTTSAAAKEQAQQHNITERQTDTNQLTVCLTDRQTDPTTASHTCWGRFWGAFALIFLPLFFLLLRHRLLLLCFVSFTTHSSRDRKEKEIFVGWYACAFVLVSSFCLPFGRSRSFSQSLRLTVGHRQCLVALEYRNGKHHDALEDLVKKKTNWTKP